MPIIAEINPTIKTNNLFKEQKFWEQFIVSSVEDGLKNNPLQPSRKFSDFENDIYFKRTLN